MKKKINFDEWSIDDLKDLSREIDNLISKKIQEKSSIPDYIGSWVTHPTIDGYRHYLLVSSQSTYSRDTVILQGKSYDFGKNKFFVREDHRWALGVTEIEIVPVETIIRELVIFQGDIENIKTEILRHVQEAKIKSNN